MSQPSKTERMVDAIEEDPELFSMAMEEILAIMDREHRAAERLESAVTEGAAHLPRGWVDWVQVFHHLRQRAEAEIIRDELRRNREGARPDPELEAEALLAE